MGPNPIAFQIGGFAVRWYSLLIFVAMTSGLLISLREVRRLGEDEDKFVNMFLFVLPAAIIGARLWYVAFQWPWYRSNPREIFALWHGGLAIHGGVFGGFLAGWIYTRLVRVDFAKWADIVAPSLILGQAIGRWGNYFNQEAYGRETNLPWAMFIDGAYRHPTFLYEFFWNLGVFALLMLLVRSRKRFEGEVALWYFLLYSAGRLWIEGLRTDSLWLGPWRVAQLVSLIGIIIPAIVIWRLRSRPEHRMT